MNTIAVLERVGWILQEGHSFSIRDTPEETEMAKWLAVAIRNVIPPQQAKAVGTRLLSDWGTG